MKNDFVLDWIRYGLEIRIEEMVNRINRVAENVRRTRIIRLADNRAGRIIENSETRSLLGEILPYLLYVAMVKRVRGYRTYALETAFAGIRRNERSRNLRLSVKSKLHPGRPWILKFEKARTAFQLVDT